MSTIRIACVGDVMCGDSFYAIGHGVASSLRRHGVAFLPEEFVTFFHQHDAVLFNLESVLSDVGRAESSLRRLHMRGRPEAASYLAQWGLTCANVANNHILEQGHACAVDTARQLREAGIGVVGAGREGLFESGLQVANLELQGQKYSILGACLLDEKYAYAGGASADQILDAVRSLAQDGRYVIVSLHWGTEFMNRPSAGQRQLARDLIDAGASVIAGHHPHVVQGIERVGRGLVAYSLGNFIFDDFVADCCWSVILTVELADGQVVAWDSVPIAKDGEHRPVMVQGRDKERLAAQVRRRCTLLEETGSPETQEQYLKDFTEADLRARRELWWRLLKTLPQSKWRFWPQLLWRPIQRKLGWW